MSKSNTQKSVPAAAAKPVVPSILFFGVGIAERGVATSFDLMQEARVNLKSAADATVSYADNLTKSALDFARSVTNRVDQLAATSLDQGKATALDVLSAARNAGTRVAEIAAGTATEAAVGLAGERTAKAA